MVVMNIWILNPNVNFIHPQRCKNSNFFLFLGYQVRKIIKIVPAS